MIKRDFYFIAILVAEFFQQKHIKKRLELIESKPITGWEIWLQVEFSVFLEAHLDVAYWEREFQYSIDRRKARHREHMAIDFIIRKGIQYEVSILLLKLNRIQVSNRVFVA